MQWMGGVLASGPGNWPDLVAITKSILLAFAIGMTVILSSFTAVGVAIVRLLRGWTTGERPSWTGRILMLSIPGLVFVPWAIYSTWPPRGEGWLYQVAVSLLVLFPLASCMLWPGEEDEDSEP